VVFNDLGTRKETVRRAVSTQACSSALPTAIETAPPSENRLDARREQGAHLDTWEDEGGSPAEAASAVRNPQWDRYIDGDMPD
jgi:hypothetical protein